MAGLLDGKSALITGAGGGIGRATALAFAREGARIAVADLMEEADLVPHERILCSNLANGARFETYVIPAERGSGQIQLNGATAHLGKIGDRLTIMAFTEVDGAKANGWKPRVIVLGKKNRISKERGI